MEQSIIQRISEIIAKNQLSPRAFANAIHFSYSTLNNYLTGRRKAIDIDLITKITSSFGDVSADWILTGKEYSVPEHSEEINETRPHIPARVAAGTLSGIAESIKSHECQLLPLVRIFPSYDYTITIQGDSMSPKFEGGDTVAIKRVYDLIEWGHTYILDTRDGAVIKRIFDAGDNYRCVSYNSEYPDILINKSSVLAVYKVVGLIRV